MLGITECSLRLKSPEVPRVILRLTPYNLSLVVVRRLSGHSKHFGLCPSRLGTSIPSTFRRPIICLLAKSPYPTMILLASFFENAEICIVADNAKTHEPKPSEARPRRSRNGGVKRTTSLPMDLSFCSERRCRRARRGSDSNVPASRWSAEPTNSPPRMKRSHVFMSVNEKNIDQSNPVTPCILRNVLKPVRQDSQQNLNQKSTTMTPVLDKGRGGDGGGLMPMMPVRQQSLRELVGCSPNKPQRSPKVDTVDLITQALKQLDSLSEDDDLLSGHPPMSSSVSLPCIPTTPL